MVGFPLSDTDRARITAAVTAAERDTSGEIVTIVAARSDRYHDVALHGGVAAMLIAPAIVALVPGLADRVAGWPGQDWGGTIAVARLAFPLLLLQTAAFLVVRYALAWTRLRIVLTPRSTKARRVRRRAVDLFRASAERRTAARVGILLYLSIDERDAEIVADAAIHAVVPPERWGDAMAALVDRVRAGDVGGGMTAAVEAIATILSDHFPRIESDMNELPDRVIEL